jgi:hypothetical protein
MIVNLLMIETRFIWPSAAHVKECFDVLSGVQSDTGPDQPATEYNDTWERSLISVTTDHLPQTVMKASIIIMIMNFIRFIHHFNTKIIQF